MADKYVRSTNGVGATGASWTLAYVDVTTGANAVSAGEKVYISQAHAESTAGAVTISATNGTIANPIYLLGVSDSAEPPTTVTSPASATISTTGANSITISGNAFVKAVIFQAGSSTSPANISVNGIISNAGNVQRYEDCGFRLANSSTSSAIILPAAATTNESRFVQLVNCSFRFGSTSQKISIRNGKVEILGGSIDAAGSAISTVFSFTASASGRAIADAFIVGMDLSAASSTAALVDVSNSMHGRVTFVDCKIPASCSLVTGTWPGPGLIVSAYNCDNGSTNYKMWIEQYAGSITIETVLVMTGGATEGSQSIAWKLATNSNASYQGAQLVSDFIFTEITSTGSSKTVTVKFQHDSATNLKNDEIWLEAYYLSQSGNPLASIANNCKADPLTAAADQPDSSQAWTTTDMLNPNNQKLTLSFTPQKAGLIGVRVKLAKANKTVYVNPDVTIS